MRATVGRTIQRTDGNDVLARHEGARSKEGESGRPTKPRYSPTLSLNVDIALVFTKGQGIDRIKVMEQNGRTISSSLAA